MRSGIEIEWELAGGTADRWRIGPTIMDFGSARMDQFSWDRVSDNSWYAQGALRLVGVHGVILFFFFSYASAKNVGSMIL